MLARGPGSRRGADGRHGRVVQQRARAAAHRAAGSPSRPATWSSRWAREESATSPSCARSPRPTSRWCSTSARRTSASSAPRSTSRVAKGELVEALSADGHRRPQRRRPAGARRWPRARRRTRSTFGSATGSDVVLGDVELDDLGRASFDLTYDGATEHVALRLVGEHQATNAAATAATALAAGLCRWTASPRACARSNGSRSGGWRSTSGPTGSSSSTTPTTPTRTRWRPRWRRSPGWGSAAAAAPSRCWARCASSGPAPSDEHRAVGALAQRLGIDEVVVVGRRRPRRSTRRCSRSAATTARRATSTPSNRPGSGCARMWRVPTSSWSRRPGPGGSNGSPTCSWGTTPKSSGKRSARGVGPLRAILLAGGLALLFTMVGTRYAIRVLAAHGYGQLIRDDGPTTHHTKRGTPTMGGLVIVLASVLAYFLATLVTRQHPERLRPAAAVPVRRPGHRRLPRRLHQDLPAAQPRPAQPREVHRPDLRRPRLRLAGAVAVDGGRRAGRPRPVTRSRSSATRAPSRCR